MRGEQGTHELSCDAPRRRKGDEVQEAVQAENKKDHARQISGDCRHGSHNSSPFQLAAINHGANHIYVNIVDGVYFGKIQESYGPRYSGDVARLARYVEGDARVDALRSSRNRRDWASRLGFPRAGNTAP